MSRPVAIQMDIGGLKCDAAGCGFRCDAIPREYYEHFVDTACPWCGANLLTAADYRAVKRIEAVVAFVNRWFWWLPKTGKPWVTSVNFDGSGQVTLTEKSAVDLAATQ